MTTTGEEQLIERVRERYAAAALRVLEQAAKPRVAMPTAAPRPRRCRGFVLWTDGAGG
jgi:hypothetical protein